MPLGKPIEEVYEGVHDGVVLGSGISGIVREVKHRTTQVTYAVKCLDLALIENEEGLRQLKEEIYIMCQLVSGHRAQWSSGSHRWRSSSSLSLISSRELTHLLI